MKNRKVVESLANGAEVLLPGSGAWKSPAQYLFRVRNVHTVRHESGWVVRREGGGPAIGVYSSKQQAVDSARTLARREGVELVIHGLDGRIRERSSYGRDARRSPRG